MDKTNSNRLQDTVTVDKSIHKQNHDASKQDGDPSADGIFAPYYHDHPETHYHAQSNIYHVAENHSPNGNNHRDPHTPHHHLPANITSNNGNTPSHHAHHNNFEPANQQPYVTDSNQNNATAYHDKTRNHNNQACHYSLTDNKTNHGPAANNNPPHYPASAARGNRHNHAQNGPDPTAYDVSPRDDDDAASGDYTETD
ncbi:hypothetical protein MFIFM68171_05683 [Madurella fahalii]|uniref:Uncharacterized protein n=1 Tax=Madurella fahalii TaxID=1157608 RepID=A0ABQ0GCK8_9PEZI